MAKIKKRNNIVWIEGNSKFKFEEIFIIERAKSLQKIEDIFYFPIEFGKRTKRPNDAFRLLVKEYREQKPEMWI